MSQRQIIQGEPRELLPSLKEHSAESQTVFVSVSRSAVFEQYQKSRMQFVQTVADLASRPQNIDILQNAGEKQLYKTVLALVAIPSVYSSPLLSSTHHMTMTW